MHAAAETGDGQKPAPVGLEETLQASGKSNLSTCAWREPSLSIGAATSNETKQGFCGQCGRDMGGDV